MTSGALAFIGYAALALAIVVSSVIQWSIGRRNRQVSERVHRDVMMTYEEWSRRLLEIEDRQREASGHE